MTDKAKKILVWSIAGALLVLETLGFIFVKNPLWETWGTSGFIATIVTYAAVFLLMYFFLIRRKKDEKVEKDERTEGIRRKAVDYSYTITYLAVIALYYVDFMGFLKLPSSSLLLILLMTMCFSFFIARFLIGRKGTL